MVGKRKRNTDYNNNEMSESVFYVKLISLMEKKKNKIKSAFALALSLGLLCQSFPAFAEEKPWDVNDNIISFREIPDLVDQFSTVAKMEQDALAQSVGGMASVQKAVKDEKADILANLQESIDSLKEQKQDTTDPTTKAFLQSQINQLEKVKNSKKILPDIDSSLAEVNQGLVQLSETEKSMKKAEAKTEKAVKSGFYTGKKLLSDGMQNLYFSVISLENNKTMLEKRVAMLQAGLEKTERQADGQTSYLFVFSASYLSGYPPLQDHPFLDGHTLQVNL